MSEPFYIKLWEATSEAYRMKLREGKKPAVTLIHPFTADLLYDDLGIERPENSEDFEVAPKFHLMRLVEDESIPLYDVCVLDDEGYLEHERLKGKSDQNGSLR